MAANRYNYFGERMLFDVTITAVNPGATFTTPITGSSETNGTGQITQIGSATVINGTNLAGLFGDLTRIVIQGPIDADGSFPDVSVWPVVDETSLDDKMVFDASVPGNMMPNKANTVGQKEVRLGIPFRKALSMNNMALKATGLKAAASYTFQVYSKAGWGNSGAAQTPLRIIGYGDKIDKQTLAGLTALLNRNGYNGSIQMNTPGFPSLVATHSLGGALGPATWTALPGGMAQQGVKVFRRFTYAYNAIATAAQGAFILSMKNAVGGASGQVVDNHHDLGFDYENSSDYLLFTEYGVRPGTNQAFVGYKVDDTVLPDENGFAVSANLNQFPYGNVQPQRAAASEYYALGKIPWDLVAAQNKVAFFVAANGTAIPANSASVAIGGVLVQGAN